MKFKFIEMKKLLQFSLFIILFISCSSDNNGLTEIKYNGFGGMSCKINGEIVKPTLGGLSRNPDCRITSVNDVPYFSVSYSNRKNNIFKLIRVVAIDVPYENMTGQTYNLKSEQNSESYAQYGVVVNNNEIFYNTNSIQNGELKILFHDRQKNIISGTFWFDAIDNNGNLVNVTDGRFDLFLN